MHKVQYILKHFIRLFKMDKVSKAVVVILGATGTGKSKLALEIASKFNGEIINADSMQIYKGLDIVTNKVTSEERAAVPHHVLDFLEPNKCFNVVDFRNRTLPIIEKLHNECKLPVIVGGTHYYVESLLWNILVQSNDCSSNKQKYEENIKDLNNRFQFITEKCKDINNENITLEKDLKENSLKQVEEKNLENLNEGRNQNEKEKSCDDENNVFAGKVDKVYNLKYLQDMDIAGNQLLKILHEIDPEMALSYHPNDRRKIIRSLEVWAQTGEPHSKFIKKQSELVGGADLGGEIRFKNAAILWVTCDQEILDKRLDARVDSMVKGGLLKELSEFHEAYNAPLLKNLQTESSKEKDHYKRGVFQCIGFKEFHDYLVLDESRKASEEGRAILEAGKERMKLRTRQYSRRQIKWIKNRFFLRDRKKIPVYAVDGSDPSRWEEKVTAISDEVVGSLITGKKPSTAPVAFNETESVSQGDKTRHFCEVCQRVFIGNHQWESHLKSSKHRKVLKRRNIETGNIKLNKSQKVSL